jgi:hypothetical protein
MMGEKVSKADELFEKYLDFISAPENAEEHLREEGLDPHAIATEGMRAVQKKYNQLLASRKDKESKMQE